MKTSNISYLNRLWLRLIHITFLVVLVFLTKPIFAEPLYGAWPANNNGNNSLGVAMTDSILNPGNVGNLQQLWMIPGTAVQSTPVIADSNVYFAGSDGTVSSYTASGAFNWKVQLYADDAQVIPEFFDESPVLTKNSVFIGGNQMHKLRRSDGAEMWHTVFDPFISQFVPPSHITPSQLMIADNLVIYGVGYTDETQGEGALFPYVHGEIIAFNQDTGARAWTLDLTKYKGVQYGPGNGTFAGGGVDTKRHLFFTSSGNNYAGLVSPISNSLLAIDYKTGKIVWHYQYASDDLWGGGGSNLVRDGNSDLDVHAHPQIFSLLGIDMVGARGKDGTYRIFARDQLPNKKPVKPIAQIQLDPATTFDGGIQIEPVIKDNTLYIASVSIVAPTCLFAGETNPGIVPCPVTGPGPVVHNSLDFVSEFGTFATATTTVRAINLNKLVAYSTLYNFKQALQGNHNPLPLCVSSAATGSNPEPIYPSNRCSGLLPANIVIWENNFTPVESLSSSGLAYNNGVLFLPSGQGDLRMLNASNGALISTITPAPIPFGPPFFGLFHGLPILGGVSIDNGKVFIPMGLAYPDPVLPGSIAVYGLPST